MINRKAIGYITANYSSSYGSVLLKDRPIASVPFLGRYRLIDFAWLYAEAGQMKLLPKIGRAHV